MQMDAPDVVTHVVGDMTTIPIKTAIAIVFAMGLIMPLACTQQSPTQKLLYMVGLSSVEISLNGMLRRQ